MSGLLGQQPFHLVVVDAEGSTESANVLVGDLSPLAVVGRYRERPAAGSSGFPMRPFTWPHRDPEAVADPDDLAKARRHRLARVRVNCGRGQCERGPVGRHGVGGRLPALLEEHGYRKLAWP